MKKRFMVKASSADALCARNLRFPLGQEDCGAKSDTKSRLTEASVSSAYKHPQLEKATLLFFFFFLFGLLIKHELTN